MNFSSVKCALLGHLNAILNWPQQVYIKEILEEKVKLNLILIVEKINN